MCFTYNTVMAIRDTCQLQAIPMSETRNFAKGNVSYWQIFAIIKFLGAIWNTESIIRKISFMFTYYLSRKRKEKRIIKLYVYEVYISIILNKLLYTYSAATSIIITKITIKKLRIFDIKLQNTNMVIIYKINNYYVIIFTSIFV